MIFPKLHIELERWKFNKEYQIYVSTFGNIKTKDKKIKKPYPFSGYMVVKVRGKSMFVHRLVLKTWKPINNADQMTVDHLDHNKRNNRLSNLEWVTEEENKRRAAEDLGQEYKKKVKFTISKYTLEHFYLIINNMRYNTVSEAYAFLTKTRPGEARGCSEADFQGAYMKLINGYNHKNPELIAKNFTKKFCGCKLSIVLKGE